VLRTWRAVADELWNAITLDREVATSHHLLPALPHKPAD
jgi:hypothetical protein